VVLVPWRRIQDKSGLPNQPNRFSEGGDVELFTWYILDAFSLDDVGGHALSVCRDKCEGGRMGDENWGCREVFNGMRRAGLGGDGIFDKDVRVEWLVKTNCKGEVLD
jgi:hypothetical protein